MEKINLDEISNYEINLLYNSDIYRKMTKELINIDLKDWKSTMWYKYYKEFQPKTLDDIYQIDSKILIIGITSFFLRSFILKIKFILLFSTPLILMYLLIAHAITGRFK